MVANGIEPLTNIYRNRKAFFFIKEKLNPDLLKTQTNSECMYRLQIDFFLDIQMNQKQ